MSKADPSCNEEEHALTSSIPPTEQKSKHMCDKSGKSDLPDNRDLSLLYPSSRPQSDLSKLEWTAPISFFSPGDVVCSIICLNRFAEKPEAIASNPNGFFYRWVVKAFTNQLQEVAPSKEALDAMFFDMENFVQSEFSQYHENKKNEWQINKILFELLNQMQILKENIDIRHCNGRNQLLFRFPKTEPRPKEREHWNLVETTEKRVILVTDDFLLAHDAIDNETVVLAPGSPVCLFRGNNVDLSSLFEYFPPSLIFFMARRLHQFTKVQLAYDCFAKIEKDMMIAKGHIQWQFDLFEDVKIDLPPMLLSVFVGHKVGYMELLPSRFYGFGIEVLDEKVVFERRDSGIANPVKLSDVGDVKKSAKQFEILPECIDYFDVCIGGWDHRENLHKGLPGKSPKYSTAAYTLAYVPQCKTFYEKYNQQFSVRNLKKLEETLKDGLNYGSHLSKAICKCLSDQDIGWRSPKKFFTLAEAQNELLTSWSKLSDINSKPFPGWGNKSKTRWSLVLHEDELHLIKSKACRTRHLSLGYGVVPVGLAVSSSERNILNQGKLTNLYDAVMKISGTEHLLAKNIELDCYIPSTVQSMKDILGAVVAICAFMGGRVEAEGVFAGSAGTPRTQKPQLVKFNLPIPLGVACSLMSPKFKVIYAPNLSPLLRDRMMLMPDSELKVDSAHNYCLPVILGGIPGNENLERALQQSVEPETLGGPSTTEPYVTLTLPNSDTIEDPPE